MRSLYSILLIAILLTACRKSDAIPPELAEISVNDIVDQDLVFQPGASFTVRTILTDDTELGQFKIDIHDDFDGHSHKTLTEKFKEIRIKNISGTQYQLEEQFTIPANASSGTYHGTIRVLDAEGNISEAGIFHFGIYRPEQPTISMNLPQSIASGSNLEVNGQIQAQSGASLKTVKIRVRSLQTGNNLIEQTYTIPPSTTTWNTWTDGNISVPIPASGTEKIFFRIWAEDSNGNNTIFETDIIIV